MEDIAIVGIANLFPGSNKPDQFWQQLLDKKDNRTAISASELDAEPADYVGKKGCNDKFYCMSGGYIRDFDFNAQPFVSDALTKKYLEQLDPLNQWALYVTEQALKDAGYWQSQNLQQCGVILGNLSFPTQSSNHFFLPLYHHIVENALQQLTSEHFKLANFTGSKNTPVENALIAGYPSALLAQAAGLGGSHFSLDAACASSCYSVKLACDYLHTGKADMMLAGAVSAADSLFVNMGFSIFQAFPENNIHAPLDKDSQGLFAAQGAGMMVLKRHSDALRDGDRIHAIIKGGALSNDGKGEFVLSPNSKGQVLAYQRAYQDAQINPSDVDYIECHATGTPKGDKVELTSMESFFSDYSNKPLLGSAKSNLGHLLTAAGMPGMFKTIYALNEGIIPATISLKNPISSKQGYFTRQQIPTETVTWPATNHLKTAGVSVFGFGGSNAHLILQPGNTAFQSKPNSVKPIEPLAIVGMDCLVGSVKNLAEFKLLINSKKHAFSALPTQRWQGMDKDQQLSSTLKLTKAPKGAYVESFDIDFLRFKIPPNEQDCLIPQQLMMMKVADNAAQDAGLTEGSNVAVLVAMGVELDLHQYRGRVNLATQIAHSLQQQGIQLSASQQQNLIDIAKQGLGSAAQLNQYTSFIGNIMASRISALWDFSGPAFTVSSEENSVYRCVEVAQNLMQTSDVEAVIIASVDLAGSLENISIRQHFAPVSEDARSPENILDARHWLVGEGAGAIVVKAQSSLNGQTAYANIDALSFSNGVDRNAILSASEKACAQANISAQQVSHVEAFASGVSDENIAEQQAFTTCYPNADVDSIKRQVGNLFNASGMVSLIKSALRLDQAVPASYIAVNGLGQDLSCAHLILSSTNQAHQRAIKVQHTKALTLIKSIKLGGADISETITSQASHPLFSALNKQINNKPLATLSQPINLDLLKINLLKETENKINKRLSRGVQMNSKSRSEIELQRQTHQAFLRHRLTAQQQIGKLIKLQSSLLSGQSEAQTDSKDVKQSIVKADLNTSTGFEIKGAAGYQYPPLQLREQYNQPEQVIYDSADLVEFAEGKISNVFGRDYAVIDNYARRVRLPTTDYLLVSRVTALDATINEYRKSSMVTEYDIPIDAPFLIDGQIPWSVAVESGQCDLMLIAYIGIDFQNKSERVYRLLDCQLTFLEEMAFGGETLRYEIHIDSYAKNGEQLLFFFHYDCYVGDKKVLIMRNGCAGFFTDEELADGKGVIHTDQDKAQFKQARKSTFKALIQSDKKYFGLEQMMHLVNGDIAACFGQEYDQQGRNPSLKFSSKKFLMIERVTHIDSQGGHWGLGILEGQKDLEAEHWYFPCHFQGDQVMAGSLMSEGCGQLVMFYMLWLGMNRDVNNARFQPMAGEQQTVRCRGQVTPQSNTLTYRMEVTEIGMLPRPFMKANIDILLDGKVVVDFKNLCVEITEQDDNSPYPVTLPSNVQTVAVSPELKIASVSVEHALDELESHLEEFDSATLHQLEDELIHDHLNSADERGIFPFKHAERPLMRVESDLNAAQNKGVIPIKHFQAPFVISQNRVPDQAPFTPWHLFEFATGNISYCFGSDFDIYNEAGKKRIPPRTPCGDLQVVTQVIDVQGQRLDFKNPASCVSEYYVPEDAWYFTKNTVDNWIPYSIIMEIALQPNGFISGYMGSTLKYPEKNLFFRNLDGSGELLKQIDLRGKTIVNKSVLLSTSMAGGAIIQSFTFDLLVEGETFYKGSAVFGYFSEESLTNQLGIDNGQLSHAWFVDNNTAQAQIEQYDLTDSSMPFLQTQADKPHYRLAGGQLNFVDQVSIVESGGKAKLGYIYAERTIDASDWFFRYHFHQDPVMPGSLGVEAIIELLQVYALKNDLGAQFTNPRFIAPLTKVQWKYRGQITPHNKQMSLDVHITAIIRDQQQIQIVGDANLSKDGLRIYEVKDIVLSIVEA